MNASSKSGRNKELLLTRSGAGDCHGEPFGLDMVTCLFYTMIVCDSNVLDIQCLVRTCLGVCGI